MRIYITTQGSRITREGRHLLVKCGEDIHKTIFVHKVSQVLIYGNLVTTENQFFTGGLL